MDAHIAYCIKYIIGNSLYMNTSRRINTKFTRFILKEYNPTEKNNLTVYMSHTYHIIKFTTNIFIHELLSEEPAIICFRRFDKKADVMLFNMYANPCCLVSEYTNQIFFEKYIHNFRMLDTVAAKFSDADCMNIPNILSGYKTDLICNVKGPIELTWHGETCTLTIYIDYIVVSIGKQYVFRRKKNIFEAMLFYSDDMYRMIRPDISVVRYAIESTSTNKLVRGVTITILPSTNNFLRIV